MPNWLQFGTLGRILQMVHLQLHISSLFPVGLLWTCSTRRRCGIRRACVPFVRDARHLRRRPRGAHKGSFFRKRLWSMIQFLTILGSCEDFTNFQEQCSSLADGCMVYTFDDTDGRCWLFPSCQQLSKTICPTCRTSQVGCLTETETETEIITSEKLYLP